jgi:hypothetical protein
MQVTFTRPMDIDSIKEPGAFVIDGTTGTVDSATSGDTQSFIYKPAAQLAYSQAYTCTVKATVKTKLTGKFLKPTLGLNGGAPAQDKDQWQFTTRCEGCGNPWLGDISAAAGISQGGTYKLFSVTGQPTPVGEATNSDYKLQSGFIYATAPAATAGQ